MLKVFVPRHLRRLFPDRLPDPDLQDHPGARRLSVQVQILDPEIILTLFHPAIHQRQPLFGNADTHGFLFLRRFAGRCFGKGAAHAVIADGTYQDILLYPEPDIEPALPLLVHQSMPDGILDEGLKEQRWNKYACRIDLSADVKTVNERLVKP